jgi:transketolase
MHTSYNLDSHRAAVRTIKGLAMDAVQAAESGHPGMPLGAADMATVLWSQFLKHDPKDPAWPDRDRFILSAGHGSMLLYSLLHLSGYDLSIDDIKAFRQWGSKTPGHPEVGHTPGVETTTGPLGQGFANGVGMATAERFLRETFGADLVDHYTYGIVSDGDLMEGVASEAASIAGHLGLGRLIYLYDDNHISIDGSTDLAFTEDRGARFRAYGWHVQEVDGHDAFAVKAAIEAAREDARPSLICCRTIIGQDSSKAGSEKSHGAPLGKEDVAATKARIGLDPAQFFATEPAAYTHLQGGSGADAHAAWQARLDAHPRRDELLAWLNADGASLVQGVTWPEFPATGSIATRKASEACLKAIVAAHPNVIGGSADLAGSNGTAIGKPLFRPQGFAGAATFAFGVREHAMGAMCNGLALHGGVVPYCATFLMFHDYMRPSVRLSCLMKQRVVYIYSHDSFFLGEDGPTHQPVETLAAMRTIPSMRVLRPADGAETVEAWKAALLHEDGPTALILTRQNLPHFDHATLGAATGLHRGAYVLADTSGTPDIVLIASGSEVALAFAARERLASEGVAARVVSAPWFEGFEAEPADYQESVLPSGVPRVAIEAGISAGWRHVVGPKGAVVAVDHFGASAPDRVLAEKFGFTPENVVNVAKQVLSRA